ncbi:MAG: YdcF family protein [Ruminococcaceae bacterium]|nr:YdcF family protein [Oscillospiraceae bacterium]
MIIIDTGEVFILKKTLFTALALMPTAVFAVSEAIASKGSGDVNADYLLILGHALENNAASPVLELRCEKAAEYLKAHPDTRAIACGGITGENQTVSEAEVIKELLISKGIDGKRIILEDKSKTTAENFYNAKKLMDETKNARVALLSSSYHLLRARTLAKLCGIEAKTVAAPTPKNVCINCFAKEFFAFPLMLLNLKEAKKNG